MAVCPDNVTDDWLRHVCTDGHSCREVEGDYEPNQNEMVFACNIRRGEATAELYRNGALT
jgi:hypothetical protein